MEASKLENIQPHLTSTDKTGKEQFATTQLPSSSEQHRSPIEPTETRLNGEDFRDCWKGLCNDFIECSSKRHNASHVPIELCDAAIISVDMQLSCSNFSRDNTHRIRKCLLNTCTSQKSGLVVIEVLEMRLADFDFNSNAVTISYDDHAPPVNARPGYYPNYLPSSPFDTNCLSYGRHFSSNGRAFPSYGLQSSSYVGKFSSNGRKFPDYDGKFPSGGFLSSPSDNMPPSYVFKSSSPTRICHSCNFNSSFSSGNCSSCLFNSSSYEGISSSYGFKAPTYRGKFSSYSGAFASNRFQSSSYGGAFPSNRFQSSPYGGAFPSNRFQSSSYGGAFPSNRFQSSSYGGAFSSYGGAFPSNRFQSSSYGGAFPSNRFQSSSYGGAFPSNIFQSSSYGGAFPSNRFQSSSYGGAFPSNRFQSSSYGGAFPSNRFQSFSYGGAFPSNRFQSSSYGGAFPSNRFQSSSYGGAFPSNRFKSSSYGRKFPSYGLQSSSYKRNFSSGGGKFPDYGGKLKSDGVHSSSNCRFNNTVPLFIFQVDIDKIYGGHFHIKLRCHLGPINHTGLELRHSSELAGFVQTPLYDGERVIMTSKKQTYATIDIPATPDVLVSFSLAEVNGCVVLKTPSLQLMSDSCWALPPSPTFYNVSNATRLYVTFEQFCLCFRSLRTADINATMTGFRMQFSFHNKSFVPEQLPSGLWNCSVSHWPHFRDHFLCNLQRECEGDEDEAGCPYSSEHCGPGYFAAGDSCFFVQVINRKKSTWTDASKTCLLRKSRLASLKTERRFNNTRQTLRLQTWIRTHFFLGLTVASSNLPLWYTPILQWADGTMDFHSSEVRAPEQQESKSFIMQCTYLKNSTLIMDTCYKRLTGIAICEKVTPHQPADVIVLSTPPTGSPEFPYVTCPSKHVTHVFLVCDAQSVCMSQDSENCAALMTPLPPSLPCRNQVGRVPYTLVCDHRADCADGSDEDFCVFQSCGPGMFSCGSGQCVLAEKLCDLSRDCLKGEDEMRCKNNVFRTKFLQPPALVDIGQQGGLILKQLEITEKSSLSANFAEDISPPDLLEVFGNENKPFDKQLENTSLASNTNRSVCPETHFQCPNNGHCLPVFLRCNGVLDCPFHEDEAGCDQYTCPGFYRCRASTVCVHQSNVCDGRPHCPQHDDELLCGFTCPLSCVCHGLAFICTDILRVTDYSALRYLDAEGTRMALGDLHYNHLLIFLNIAHCGLVDIDEGYQFANLLILDISDNFLTSMEDSALNVFPRMQELSLSGNPLVNAFGRAREYFPSMRVLHLSRVHMPRLDISRFSIFTDLHTLNLSHSGVDVILGTGFQSLNKLRVLDLRGCPLAQFPGKMFQTLSHLQSVYAQSYRLCCPVLLPSNFNLRNCLAPSQDVSSCEDLLGSVPYKICVFIVAFVALVGNSATFVYRTILNRSKAKMGFSVFVTHLSVSDFLMGVYLTIVGLADQVYLGNYVWNDAPWRHSSTCSMAGFLSLLSSEVSALIVCAITIDRFLVLCFPFSRLNFGVRSAHTASALVWILCLVMCSIPLLPLASHWQFYGQTGICSPLPVSGSGTPGKIYSFSIIVVFNFVLFVFISFGQLFIYMSVRANSMSTASTTHKTKDLTIARRLITVAMSDFLCWFPIGVLGLLSSSGFSISAQVNVTLAVFVLPLNAALNPFLYTVNVIQEKRRCAHVERMKKLIVAQLSKTG